MAIETTRRQFLTPTLALFIAACRKQEPDLCGFTEEEAPHLSSSILMADPRTASQLLSGWHKVEENAWRWTAGHFVAVLRPPPGSARLGARLDFRFNIPEPVLKLLKVVSISASVGDVLLSLETYVRPGDHDYSREIPSGVLSGDSVRVDFTLSKAMPPSPADARELGVIAHSLSLETR